MKSIHIVAFGMIIIAVVLLITASGDMSTYSTFADADRASKKVKVVALLSKDKEMYYNPEEDPNFFSFYARDLDGHERKVVLLGARPRDFELSEQIVITGKMKEGAFVASDLLLKCPSKYKDEEIYLKKES